MVASCAAPVDVLAHSFGGLVALEAGRLGLPIGRLVVYEPSIDDDPDFPAVVDRIRVLVDQGQVERAAETLLVERSGVHLATHTAPDLLASEIVGFLNR